MFILFPSIRPLKRLLPLCLAPLVWAFPVGAQILHPSDPEDEREIQNLFGPGARAPYQARHGMVSTSSHHATMAGLETLRAGGNAFDAAAVVQFVLNVAEPYASGIGGGLFVVAYDAGGGEVITLDGREEAPKAIHPDLFRDAEGKIIPYSVRFSGGQTVGVPGTLAAIAELLETHGTLTLAEALQPAIRLARDGFIIPEPFARGIQTHLNRLQRYPDSLALFSRPDGGLLQAGDLFRNPDLARTLEQLAQEGTSLFYQGELAQEIAQTLQNDPHAPGFMTVDDLANYRPVRRSPISVDYNGYKIYSMNMPSSGGVTLGLILNLLESQNYAAVPADSARSIHLLAEAQNLAFADRNHYMGDADFVDVPVAGLLDKAYARSRASLTTADKALSTPIAPGQPQGAPSRPAPESLSLENPSTTHFSIVDRDRNVVSITSTIEQSFGSAMVVPGRGFLLNNELTDFDAEAHDAAGRLVPNAPQGGWQPRRTALGDDARTEGGKRHRSSMVPTIVFQDGEPRLVVGSPGGSRIIGITLNVILNVIDHRMDVQSAINAPRIVARNGSLELEAPLYRNEAIRRQLEARGFNVINSQAVGAVQAIWIGRDGWMQGAADPRREGLAVGF